MCRPHVPKRFAWPNRILVLDDELADNRDQITTIVEAQAPQLLDLPGVGAITGSSQSRV